jgi:hypothetical protein
MQNSNNTPRQTITSRDEGATATGSRRGPSDVDHEDMAVAMNAAAVNAAAVNAAAVNTAVVNTAAVNVAASGGGSERRAMTGTERRRW